MIKQQSYSFESYKESLFAELFIPTTNSLSKAYVICAPFAEEKKSAHRSLVDLAKSLSEKGFPVLLFDYSGCGDSSGEFCDATLTNWIKDINNAISFLKEKTGIKHTGLIGLRLGAYLLLQKGISPCDEYVLIEPVINPSKYFRQILRQKLMKELITDGKVSSNRNELVRNLGQQQSIDFDGYEISPAFYDELKQYSGLEVNISSVHKPTLFLHISHTGKISREVEKFHPSLEENNNILFRQLKLEPFWERIENAQYNPMIDEVVNFCTHNHE